jgi:aarF domain-containing kinase
MIRGGDFSMLKVWVGLEARSFLQASIDTVRISASCLEGYANML